MLPKVNKNLFKEKTKQVNNKKFNFKTFLLGVLFAGTTAVAGVNTPTDIQLNNLIKEQKQASFMLKPSAEGLLMLATHHSHSSHASHASHSSHASSSYDYSS